MRHTYGVNPSGIQDSTSVLPGRSRANLSVEQVFALVAGFVALATIGAALGWFLTDPASPKSGNAGPVVSPSVTMSLPEPTPSSEPPSSPSGYVLPDYEANSADFITARDDLTAHKLGVELIFNPQGSDPRVLRTDPPAGTSVANGITVKVYVSGPAPTLDVQNVVGETCARAGKELAGDGLIPQYPNGKSGIVAVTDPVAGAPNVSWNQQIQITCTPDGSLPQPSDGPSSPATDPSSSAGAGG
jgi:hypothetical protein